MANGYEHVPTLPELHAKGLAHVVGRTDKGEPTHYRATSEGQRIIDETMRRNAAWARAHPDGVAAQWRDSMARAIESAPGKKK